MNIKSNGWKFCYCKEKNECKLCKITRIYYEYEYKLYENMFDLDFSIRCHASLYCYINRLFNTRKHCACCYLHQEFSYKWKDWYNGKVYSVSLMEAIQHKEEHDKNQTKYNNFENKLEKWCCANIKKKAIAFLIFWLIYFAEKIIS